MKFKTYVNKYSIHKTPVSCIDWNNNEEVYTVSDNHQIYKWDCNRNCIEIAKLPEDFIPTDLDWLLGKSGGGGGKGNDSLLISSNDGRFIILSKNARVERNVSAHSMAITSGKWSPDGSSLLTASEDGIIKIWSRSGMLRSIMIQSEESIRCARWSPSSNAIVFCQSEFMSIKPLAANSKLLKWRAHEGLIMCVSWSSNNNLIASGGEDCRYKVWDQQGTNLYTSSTDESVITSIEFCPVKDLLAVGSFNILKLCDENGWFYSNSRFDDSLIGSIYGITWSPDGTQVACGTSSGNVIFGHVIEKELISKNLKVTTVGRKSILLQDIVSETSDILEFSERIINYEIGYGHLIVATSNQIHIFNENYINTPIIIDSRVNARIIEIGIKFFLIIDSSSIWIYTYTGRLHLNPRFPGSQAQYQNLNAKSISLGMNILAIRDLSDQTLIYSFDLIPGATRQSEPTSIRLKDKIIEIAVCRSGNSNDQYIAVINTNKELFIMSSKTESEQTIHKIGTQLITIMWGNESNILVGLHDSCYSIWYCPGEASIDPTLIALTTVTIDSSEFGKYISLHSFEGDIITFRSSGTLYTINVNIYANNMHKAVTDGQWKNALKICRLAQNTILWATLAAIATKYNQFEISEEAYCAALQIDKVYYLQHIRKFPLGSPEYVAEISLMMGRSIEAETILLQNQKFKEAVDICIRMNNWQKALEISETYKIELDRVLNERKKYLLSVGKKETNEKFFKM